MREREIVLVLALGIILGATPMLLDALVSLWLR